MEEENRAEENKAKTSSIWIGTGAFIVSLLLDIGIPYFFEKAAAVRDILPALIIGLTFYIVFQIRTLTNIFKAEHKFTRDSLNSSYTDTKERIMTLLNLEKKIYKSVSFIKYLEILAHSTENIESKPKLTKKYFYELIEEYISFIRGISEGAAVRYIPYESERISRINKILEEADKTIYAVTYDVDGYLLKFWAGEDLDKYIELNKNIAKRNVKIYRIFVVDEDFQSNDLKKNLIFKIKQKCEGIDNLSTKIISRTLAEARHRSTSSFILVDNEIASESSTGVRSLRDRRYIAFSNDEINEQLLQRFKIFDSIEPIKITPDVL